MLALGQAREPFKLFGVRTRHLPFCEALSAACRCKFDARRFHEESVATFEPDGAGRS